MEREMIHFAIVAGVLALGLYLFAHPRVLSSRSRLVRGVIIWLVLVFVLRALDYIFPLAG